MFTGIVEEIGQVISISNENKSKVLKISCKKVIQGINIGDSICTNGVCLTATNLGNDYFEADVMMETLKVSNLCEVKEGELVNLERALGVNDRFNGHIVSGHIDGVGNIISFNNVGNSTVVRIGCSKDLLKYMIYKGSITLDGVSLTISNIKNQYFEVSIIPHTKDETILLKKKVKDGVNIECDMMAKYIEKLLGFNNEEGKKSNVTLDLLKENGFV